MNEPVQSTADFAELQREAQQWVTRLTSGEATTADAEALHHWRQKSRAHRRALAEANLLWDKLHSAAVEAEHRQQVPVAKVPQRRVLARPVGRRAFLGGAAAAASAAAAYAVIQPPLQLWPSLAEITADYRTGTGQQRQLSFGGNVSVQLNTRTSIAVLSPPEAAGAVERIELISGEAAVAAGSARPFEVIAARGRTTATNARFNVRNVDGAVCVTCLQGQVEIEHRNRITTVSAAQQVTYTADTVAPVSEVDPEQVTAWERGLLIFRDAPLERVIDEVNRYRPGRIILANAELGRRSVLATFHLDRLDEVVPRLQIVFGLRVRKLPGGLVLMS